MVDSDEALKMPVIKWTVIVMMDYFIEIMTTMTMNNDKNGLPFHVDNEKR